MRPIQVSCQRDLRFHFHSSPKRWVQRLETDLAPGEDHREHEKDSPDEDREDCHLRAVIEHDEQVPEAEDAVEDAVGDGGGKLVGQQGHALHTERQVADLIFAEERGGQRQELDPKRGFRRHPHMILETHHGQAAHEGNQRAGNRGHEHDLHDEQKRLLVIGRNDVAEDGLGDQRRDDGNQSRDEAAEQEQPIVALPAEPRRPSEPLPQAVHVLRHGLREAEAPGIEGIGFLFVDGDPGPGFVVDALVAVGRRGQSGVRFAVSGNQDRADVLPVPVGDELDLPGVEFSAADRPQDFPRIGQVRGLFGQTEAAAGNAEILADLPQGVNRRRLVLVLGAADEGQIGNQVPQELAVGIGDQEFLGSGKFRKVLLGAGLLGAEEFEIGAAEALDFRGER